MTDRFATLERTESGGLIRFERVFRTQSRMSGPRSRNLSGSRTGGLRSRPTSALTSARGER